MLFSSTIFIFAFLPAVLIGYFLLAKQYRNYYLLLMSLGFYAWGEPKFAIVMIFSIIVNYIYGLLIDKSRPKPSLCKAYLILAIATNLSILFVFKYLNFTIFNINKIFGNAIPQTHIVLLLGVSFFTFQAMSYVVDVYRNVVHVQKNIFYFGMFKAFFPQLIAGPIVRYSTVEEQITDRKVTFDSFSEGVRRFMIGISKKVLIANNVAIIADKAFGMSNAGGLSVSFAWLGVIAYAFQIFFDFSGYSDMAIGLGRMFGFKFLENFNYPYISKSVTEFWRRWHVSLGTWFKDYVYFPLGGSRVKSRYRLVFNLFVVWFLTGFWHGASWNFVAWGLLYFVLLVFEKLILHPEKLNFGKYIYQIFTLIFVLIGWVLFRSKGFGDAIIYVKSMFGLSGNPLFDPNTALYINEKWVFLLFAVLCSTPVFKICKERMQGKGPLTNVFNVLGVLIYVFLFLLSISYLVVGAHNPFIYFNF